MGIELPSDSETGFPVTPEPAGGILFCYVDLFGVSLKWTKREKAI